MKDILIVQDFDTPPDKWCIKFINTNGNNNQTHPLTRAELKTIATRILGVL